MTTTDWIATAALIISIISASFTGVQAYLQHRQFKLDNRGIAVGYTQKSQKGTWNVIHMTNLSSRPISVDDWVLTWKKRRWIVFSTEKQADSRIYPESRPLTLHPHVRENITLDEVNDFRWDPKTYKGDLHIDLHLSGDKRIVRLLVYKPSKWRPKEL